MRIPLPCEFGDIAKSNGEYLPLHGVPWFQWTEGIEYTYFFTRNDFWHEMDFYTAFDVRQPCGFYIRDDLLIDRLIKEHGYPLKGRGYVSGIYYRDGKLYLDFIMTSYCLTHIRVQCDDTGEYVRGGNNVFPPSWDTKEKRKNAVLKSYKRFMN